MAFQLLLLRRMIEVVFHLCPFVRLSVFKITDEKFRIYFNELFCPRLRVPYYYTVLIFILFFRRRKKIMFTCINLFA